MENGAVGGAQAADELMEHFGAGGVKAGVRFVQQEHWGKPPRSGNQCRMRQNDTDQ